jgi:hypothetical protein
LRTKQQSCIYRLLNRAYFDSRTADTDHLDLAPSERPFHDSALHTCPDPEAASQGMSRDASLDGIENLFRRVELPAGLRPFRMRAIGQACN